MTLKNKLKKLIAIGAIATTIASVIGISSVSAAGNGTKYTGNPIEPAINLYDDSTNPATLLEQGRDYDLTYRDNINVGTGYIIVSYKGNYEGTKEIPFQILARPLNQNNIVISPVDSQEYTGVPIEPQPDITYGDRTLVNNTDYDIVYSNNENVGTATGTITFKGNYEGNANFTFEITRKTLSQSDVDISQIDDITFTGSPITPEPTIMYGDKTFVKDVDYTLSYNNNTNVGVGNVVITFIGNYDGEAATTFNIVSKTLNQNDITISEIPEQTYTGDVIEPKPEVRYGDVLLVEGEDYNITYDNNTGVGTGKVKIEFIGNYDGNAEKEFTINARVLTKDDLTVEDIPAQAYTGNPIEPKPIVKVNDVTLIEGVDFNYVYENNTNVGTATMKIELIGNYAGSVPYEFEIAYMTLSEDNVTIAEIEPERYNYLPHEPKPEVRLGNTLLTEGVDFVFEYDNNIDAGTADIKVVGIGNYDGSVSGNFTIRPKDGSQFTYYIIFFDEDDE